MVVARETRTRANFFLKGIQPPVHQSPERTIGPFLRGQALDGTPIDLLHVVQGSFGLGDLNLGGGESLLLRHVADPTGEEGLAGAVVAANRLEATNAHRDIGKLALKRLGEAIQAHGVVFEPSAGHGAVTKGRHNFSAPRFGDSSWVHR